MAEGLSFSSPVKKDKSRLLKIWISLIIFLLPLFFIPSLFDAYGFPKIAFLLGGTLMGWLIFLGEKFFKKEKVILFFPRWFWPALFLVAVFAVSSLLTPVAATRISALSGKTAIILGGFLLAFLIFQAPTLNPQLPLVASSLVLSLILIGQYLGLLKRWFSWSFLGNATWSPTGAILSALVLIMAGFIYLLTLVIRHFRSQEKLSAAPFLALGAMVVLVLGVILGTLNLVEAKPALLSPQVAWVVAVENFKSWQGAFFGSGPGNFSQSFVRFRPATVNATSFWNAVFSSSFNEYLNLLTEVGLFGLGAFLLLLARALGKDYKSFSPNFIFLIIVALFLPFDLVLWFFFFVLLGVSGAGKASPRSYSPQLALAPLAALLFSGWWYSRLIAADIAFARSLDAFNRGEGGNAYNLQIKALEKNPYQDFYHLAYANTNLALADTLSRQENLTDQDKQQVSILIQQAIREGKAAVAANPLKADNWYSLAQIYQQIIGVAEGAQQWALDSLRQAVLLDPVNPNLRLAWGGLYYALGDFESAQRQFEIAAELKADHANAHYNLAAVYKAQEKWEKAALEMKTVLSLVEPDSADFEKAKEELEEIEAKLPKTEEGTTPAEKPAKGESQLQEFSPLPTPQVSPIQLPEEEAAPQIPVPLNEETIPEEFPSSSASEPLFEE
ncbi:hypothetical protein KBI33_03865 [Candidatus Shapirobacteria bacterium]|nr:hypothetical protein [Candidatus Shapirobacteria bacterium]